MKDWFIVSMILLAFGLCLSLIALILAILHL